MNLFNYLRLKYFDLRWWRLRGISETDCIYLTVARCAMDAYKDGNPIQYVFNAIEKAPTGMTFNEKEFMKEVALFFYGPERSLQDVIKQMKTQRQ